MSSVRREISLVRVPEDGEPACCICFKRFANAVISPCGHSGFCWTCVCSTIKSASVSNACPICRKDITGCTLTHPISMDLTREERVRAKKLEIDAYEQHELQAYAESFGMTAEEMVKSVTEQLDELELSD